MRLLMIVGKIDVEGKSPWLTDELAVALASQGHSVKVLHLDWYNTNSPRFIERDGIEIHTIPTMQKGKSRMGQALKWSVSPLTYFSKLDVLRENYDAIIFFSPLITAYPLTFFKFMKSPVKLCVYWDFFPYHQVKMGVMPQDRFTGLLHQIEKTILKQMDRILLMSDRNLKAFIEVFDWKDTSKLGLLSIWGNSKHPPQAERSSPSEKNFAVFGGQLIPGRNVENLVAAAAYLPADTEILIYGDGPLKPKLEALIQERQLGQVRLMGQVSRDEYLAAIAHAKVGLIITDVNAQTHSFPSKVIDYFKSKLPVLAITEQDSDFSTFITSVTRSGHFLSSEEPQVIAEAIVKLMLDPERQAMGQRGNEYFYANMTAEAVAGQLIEEARRLVYKEK